MTINHNNVRYGYLLFLPLHWILVYCLRTERAWFSQYMASNYRKKRARSSQTSDPHLVHKHNKPLQNNWQGQQRQSFMHVGRSLSVILSAGIPFSVSPVKAKQDWRERKNQKGNKRKTASSSVCLKLSCLTDNNDHHVPVGLS